MTECWPMESADVMSATFRPGPQTYRRGEDFPVDLSNLEDPKGDCEGGPQSEGD